MPESAHHALGLTTGEAVGAFIRLVSARAYASVTTPRTKVTKDHDSSSNCWCSEKDHEFSFPSDPTCVSLCQLIRGDADHPSLRSKLTGIKLGWARTNPTCLASRAPKLSDRIDGKSDRTIKSQPAIRIQRTQVDPRSIGFVLQSLTKSPWNTRSMQGKSNRLKGFR